MKTEIKFNDFIHTMRMYLASDKLNYLYYLPEQKMYYPVIEPLHKLMSELNMAELVHKKRPNLHNHFSK